MRVSVFGLGYVGAVACGCLARDGLKVVGVDVNREKVATINEGRSPIVEDQIGDIIASAVTSGRLRATTDSAKAVAESDISLISVGTPSKPNGAIDFSALERVCQSIGEGIAAKSARHLVVVRSTVLPGTVRSLLLPRLEEASRKKHRVGFGIISNPEFLRESSSVRDYYDPPFTLIGSDSREDGERVAALYAGVQAPIIHCSIETAEMVKYVCNAFHALKVTFANEIGILAQSLAVDSRQVMDIVCRDTKLNISPRYLKPGFAFGGSCLPKDLRALVQTARQRDLNLPLVNAIGESNRVQISRALELVLATDKKKIAVLGLSFKAGTDDLRESPLVTLTEALIGKGFDVRIYDQGISLTKLIGANQQYAAKELPHLSSLMGDDLGEVLRHGEVVIVGNSSPEFQQLPTLCRDHQIVIDLVGIDGFSQRAVIHYLGIAW